MAMLFIIMKQMILLMSYLFLMGTNLFGAFVPHQWLVRTDIWFGSFQSAFIVVAFGRNFSDPLQSVFFCCIWQEFVSYPFQSASIDAASWREVSFWFLLSQRLLWPHLAGSCFWFLFSLPVCFWYLFSQHLLMPHLGGRLVFGFF